MEPCNICGNARFKPAPLGRLTPAGLPPACTACGSLERHRAFRSIFNTYRSPRFKEWSCLMFSKDPSVATGWFGRFEYSIFGTATGLDVQAIDRPSRSFDVVVCNHVLEHVSDYRRALREIGRITTPGGFAFISFPNPKARALTDDWGYPKPEQHGHYRIFGRDVEEVFKAELPDFHALRASGRDPSTGETDIAYILTRSDDRFAEVFERGVAAKVAAIRQSGPAASSRESSGGPDRRSMDGRQAAVATAI
ncbi:MAG TPA: class I SAM-dependent methyltransferase [Stellaceae bacterium]|nr:class I SAM-dependent methyltransferase [Stellaceae bacterium]